MNLADLVVNLESSFLAVCNENYRENDYLSSIYEAINSTSSEQYTIGLTTKEDSWVTPSISRNTTSMLQE